jgi:hypothetical protein
LRGIAKAKLLASTRNVLRRRINLRCFCGGRSGGQAGVPTLLMKMKPPTEARPQKKKGRQSGGQV